MLKFIDLFSGVGGFHFAFKGKAKCVFASEWDKKARETYLENHGEDMEGITYDEDISKCDIKTIPEHDILCAGFPCQPFSLAGSQLGFKHKTQGTLFYNILDIIDEKKPKVLFLENVKNLVSHKNGKTYEIIINSLKERGYYIKDNVLNGSEYGNVPQNRERIFIVAFKNKEQYDKFEFPEKIALTKTIDDILEKNVDDKYYQRNLNSPSVKIMHEQITKKGTFYQYRRNHVRENKKQLCFTLTANMGTGGHNVPLILDEKGIRKLTPRECFRLQGYPDSFKFPQKMSNSSLYKQAGNSIVLSAVERIADNILKTF